MVFKFLASTSIRSIKLVFTSVADTPRTGWIYWDRAAWFAPDRVRHVYEDLPSYQPDDSNMAGKPCHRASTIAGRRDAFCRHRRQKTVSTISCAIRALLWQKVSTRCRELGSDIEALRFYESIANANCDFPHNFRRNN